MNFATPLETLQGGFDWAWRTSLEASVLIALVFLVQWLGEKRLPPRVGYVLWMLVLVRLAMPAVPASRMSIFNLRPAPATIEFQPVVLVPASIPALPVTDAKETDTLPITLAQSVAPAATFGWREVIAFAWPAVALGLVGLAAMFHLKTARRLRQEQPISDPPVLALMEECRTKLGLRANVPLISAKSLRTPAVFGWWRPRILLPPDMMSRLETRELRMVLLHELVHIQRRDVLLNWFVILVRALHWFNPLVWLAVKRLRAERELICDRRVLALLKGEEERRCYGETLLKLLTGFSRPALNPSLVPLLTNKQTLKRRITMIAKYRPASRLAVVAAAALLVPLCCLTFTRAATGQAKVETQGSAASVSGTQKAEGIAILERELAELDKKVKSLAGELDDLKLKLGTSGSESAAASSYSAEGDTRMALARAEVISRLARERSLLEQLRKLTGEQLNQAIITVQPDSVLAALMQDHSKASTRLVSLSSDFGRNHPEVLKAQAEIKDLNQKIDVRTDGILRGMAIRIRAGEEELGALTNGIAQVGAALLLEGESLRGVESVRIDLESMLVRDLSLYTNLISLPKEDLPWSILTHAQPDPVLQSALNDLTYAEAKMIGLTNDFGHQSSEVVNLKAQISYLKQRLEKGVQVWLDGIKAKIVAQSNQLAVIRATKESKVQESIAKAALASEYYRKKIELENLQRFRDATAIKLAQEKVDAAIPREISPPRTEAK